MPVITCPADVIITIASGCDATGVSIGTPVTSDNCGVASVTNNHPSTTYPVGSTFVTWTVTDLAGNTATCIQLVKVIKAVVLVNYSYSQLATGPAPASIVPNFTAPAVTGNMTFGSTGSPTLLANTTVITPGVMTGPLAFMANNETLRCLRSDLQPLSNSSFPYYQFQISGLSSFRNYQLYFQQYHENASNPDSIVVYWSTDGVTYTRSGLSIFLGGSNKIWHEAYQNLSAITAINNQPNVYFRIYFVGLNGNPDIRFDNFQFSAQDDNIINATAASTNVTCFGLSNGTITITNNSPVGWEYTINGGATWQLGNVFTGLAPGIYDVRMRYISNAGCEVVINAALVITQPAVLAATATATNVNCFGASTGTVTVTASGGTTAYSYVIAGPTVNTTGAISGVFTGLTAGSYTVTVTDSKGCTTTATANITQPATALAANITAQTNVNCTGQSTGSATVTASGGTSPYTYSWSPSGGTGATASGLAAGTYTVTVTDANSCTATATVTIINLNPLPTAVISGTTTICNGSSATITVTLTGTAPWSITYTDGTTPVTVSGINTSPYTFNVSPGINTTYTVTAVSDVNCTGTVSGSAIVTVNTPATVVAGGPNTVCQSASPTAIVLSGASVGGGATTGAWSITSGGGTLSSTAQTASSQTVTYTPAANFTGTVTLTLTTNAPGVCPAVSATRTIIVNPKPNPVTITHN